MGAPYRNLYLPDHPMANVGGYVAEHRFIMSQKLGRPLLRYEHVHHINGDKRDNRSENLELITAREHGQMSNPRKPERQCAICKRAVRYIARGLCLRCYQRAWAHTRARRAGRDMRLRVHQQGKLCVCGNPAQSRAMCKTCYARAYDRHFRERPTHNPAECIWCLQGHVGHTRTRLRELNDRWAALAGAGTTMEVTG